MVAAFELANRPVKDSSGEGTPTETTLESILSMSALQNSYYGHDGRWGSSILRGDSASYKRECEAGRAETIRRQFESGWPSQSEPGG